MKYERFEQLPVWQAGIELAVKTYAISKRPALRRERGLRDQIERAAVSISNNIAEGFERGTTQELLTFLYISRGSAGEARSMLCLLDLLPDFANLKSEISNLKSLAVSISRQLGAWANTLQSSDIKGQRYVTQKTRQASEAARQREEFLEELRMMQADR